jgi:rod shape determining protein RodA
MAESNNIQLSKGIDWVVVVLYCILISIGLLCIFMVEYNSSSNWFQSFINGKTNYSKQLIFILISAIIGVFILLSDSKLYTAFANLSYVCGIGLMLLTFIIGKEINGSKSWIPLGGGFNLQPAELCKIFTSLALSKYIARQETDFSKLRSQLIAAALVLFPAVLSILQNETGLALVYTSFFLVMYREGMPGWILIVGFSVGVLVVATLVLEPNLLAIILSAIAILMIYILRKQIRRRRGLLVAIIFLWALCVGIQRFAVPYIFNNVFQCYQSRRIYSMVGKDYDCSKNKNYKGTASEKPI